MGPLACTLAPTSKYGWTIVHGGYQWIWRRDGDAACSQITLGNLFYHNNYMKMQYRLCCCKTLQDTIPSKVVSGLHYYHYHITHTRSEWVVFRSTEVFVVKERSYYAAKSYHLNWLHFNSNECTMKWPSSSWLRLIRQSGTATYFGHDWSRSR